MVVVATVDDGNPDDPMVGILVGDVPSYGSKTFW